jgi:hypothetical protein
MSGMNSKSDKGANRVSNQVWINRGRANANTTAIAKTFQTFTVAALPVGVLGDRAIVTDATTPAFNAAVVGAGAVVVPVFNNGSIWICN